MVQRHQFVVEYLVVVHIEGLVVVVGTLGMAVAGRLVRELCRLELVGERFGLEDRSLVAVWRVVVVRKMVLVVRKQVSVCKLALVVRRRCAGQEVRTRALVFGGKMVADRTKVKGVHSSPSEFQSAA